MTHALEGVRVVDLTERVAGPYCTKLMALQGAEVVKIEPPGTGDAMRGMGPFVGGDPHPEKGVPFLYLNTGKKSVTLDVGQHSARGLLLELVGRADVLVEDYAPGYLASIGLSHDTLLETNPRLVVSSITHFGQDGPYSGYKGEEIVDQAVSGHVSITGEPDREPIKMGGNLAQYAGGQAAFASTLIALYHAVLTGEGQHVDNSITEANVDLLDSWGINSLFGEAPTRLGNAAPEAVLRGRGGLYETADGYIALGQVPGGWGAFADMVGAEELHDPKYADPRGRSEHRDELEAIVAPWVRQNRKLDIYNASQQRRLAVGYVATPQDMLTSPQLEHRRFFQERDHPVAGSARYPGPPYRLTASGETLTRAPLLGEHNVDIYCDLLGLERGELVRLRQLGVV